MGRSLACFDDNHGHCLIPYCDCDCHADAELVAERAAHAETKRRLERCLPVVEVVARLSIDTHGAGCNWCGGFIADAHECLATQAAEIMREVERK